jgi:hypothetical protein
MIEGSRGSLRWRPAGRAGCRSSAGPLHFPPATLPVVVPQATASSPLLGAAWSSAVEEAWRSWRRAGSRLPCRAAALLL